MVRDQYGEKHPSHGPPCRSVPARAAYLVQQCTDGIYIENGIHILNNNSQTLQTHTCIDILLDQFRIIAVSVIIELSKYVVPDFHITVAVAAYGTSGLAAAILLSAVIVDLRAGAAGACAMLPEVVFFAKAEDPLCRDADFLVPDVGKPRHRPGIPTGTGGRDPVPPPRSGTPRTSAMASCLKVIAEGKVSQHLEKGAVAGGLSDVLDIAGTDALLAGGHPSFWAGSPGR